MSPKRRDDVMRLGVSHRRLAAKPAIDRGVLELGRRRGAGVPLLAFCQIRNSVL